MPHVVADELFHEIAHGATHESPLWAEALLPEPERRAEPVFSSLVPDPRFALGVETIYEGYLLHYGRARLFAPPDGDVTLLLGDALLAHGLVRIAETGSIAAVGDLAELLSLCAQARADGLDGDGPAWAATSALLGAGRSTRPGRRSATSAIRRRSSVSPGRQRATMPSTGRSRHTSRASYSIAPMLAALWFLADAAEEGKDVVLMMLVVGLVFLADDRDRRAHALPGRQAPPGEARPAALGAAPRAPWRAPPPTSASGSPCSSARASSSASPPRSTPTSRSPRSPTASSRPAGPALLFENVEGLAAAAPDQPVRHRAAHVPRLRRRAARRRRRQARGGARAAAAAGARRQGAQARDAEVDRRLGAEVRLERPVPGDRARRATTSTSTCFRSCAAGRSTRRRSSRCPR